ncbi:NERD domain-containing protein [Desulfohalobiaceae bacterium Ax17]|uniref:nuclease-related domain-containing protein n=1 Tax=Desulfovulcanus ferrireducens TaxID=2831190 RepID=UPI00207BB827|nr:nuclease-related domain-containing protein [Desulfovulcanus ferrireducens]MBT8762541.1 NERD domain-containing protein [Desulfovulcanus ferrireducens]
MIIKERDSRENEIQELKKLLELPITSKQRFLIERELRALKKGTSGEDDSAYYINFYYGDSKNWAVIHDLRIEYEGKVAQIDHVMIGRMLDIFVIESKNYSYGVRINDKGEFELLYNNKYHGIASPIEQNKRHIYILKKFLSANNILPKRVGLTLKPKFRSLVLISPKAIIERPPENEFDTSMVIKADALDTTVQGYFENVPISELLTIVLVQRELEFSAV